MSKLKPLTRRQRAVIEDLFTSEMKEQEVLDRHHVSRTLYSRWLADERFNAEFEERIAQAHRAGRIVLARAAAEAANKLVTLAQGESGETTRKVCLDIISAQTPGTGVPATPHLPDPQETPTCLTPETASRILAILAESRPSTMTAT